MATFRIRAFEESDVVRVPEITTLLHRAYGPLAAEGMRFFASHQQDKDTLHRLRRGPSFLAVEEDRILGTISFFRPGTHKGAPWYERRDVSGFGQWGVEPEAQGHGVGRALLEHVETMAVECGASEIACDTSERAARLIALYERRGYRRVGDVQWDVTNYRSIIFSKALR